MHLNIDIYNQLILEGNKYRNYEILLAAELLKVPVANLELTNYMKLFREEKQEDIAQQFTAGR